MLAVLFSAPSPARGQTCTGFPPSCTATTSAELAAAIGIVNASGGTVVLGNNITLTGNLPTVTAPNVTIDGGGFTLSGNNAWRGLVIGGGNTIATIQNLTIQNTVADGGAGSDGQGGGGGGAGLGGALFINNTSNVTVTDVNIVSSAAVGGAGGAAIVSLNGGNGGGPSGGSGGVGTSPTPGGAGGFASGGGGGGGAPAGLASGGAGGFGGGAGGSSNLSVVAGGFGGGGNGGTASGGGGAGMGGAVFVQSGGSLTINGTFTINGNSVTGGAAGAGATSGSAFGSGIFFQGNALAPATLTVATNSTATIADTIADAAGSGGAGLVELTKGGSGTLTLSGNNTYSGGTNITAGTLSVSSDANLGAAGGAVLMSPGTTLAITGSNTFARDVGITTNGTINVAAGQNATWSGVVLDGDLAGRLTVNGGGTLSLTNLSNSYSLGTSILGNSTVRVSDDLALGDPAGGVTLGGAAAGDGGTLAFATTGSIVSARGYTLDFGGGTFDTSASLDVALTGGVTGAGRLTKTGAGTLILNGANSYLGGTTVSAGTIRASDFNVFGTNPSLTIGPSGTVDFDTFSQTLDSLSGTGSLALTGAAATLTIGGTNASSTFDGVISGAGGIVKAGSGTLALNGANTFAGGLALNAGTLRVSSDANLGGAGTVAMSDATTLDLTSGGTYAHALAVFGTSSLNAASGQTVTWSGQIADNASPGALRLTGGGTFALTNATNSYSGGTIVAGGSTLNFSSDATLGAAGAGLTLGDATTSGTLGIGASTTLTRGITLGAAGGNVTAGAATAATLGGVIGGTGPLRLLGGGTFSLTNAANSYSGGTTVAGGSTLNLTSAAALGGGGLTLGDATTTGALGIGASTTFAGAFTLGAAGGGVTAGSGTSVTLSGAIGGAGALRLGGGGTFALTNAGNSFAGGTLVAGGSTLNFTSAAVLGSGGLTLGDATTTATLGVGASTTVTNAFTVGAGGGGVTAGGATSVTLSGAIGGTGPLRLAGGGIFSLTNAGNSYSGGTIVTGGSTLNFTSGAVLGSGGLTLGDATTTGALGVGASTTVTNAFTVGAAGGGVTAGGGTAVTLSGAIGGAGALRLNGGGTFAVTNGANSYSGGTTVIGGSTLNFAGDAALGGGTLTLGDATTGGTLGIGGSTTVSHVVTLGAGGGTVNTGAGTISTLAGTISGTGGLAKTGAGTLTLSGANTFSGGLALNAGSLRISADGNLGGAGTVAMSNATTLDITSSGSYAHALSVAGTSVMQAGAGQSVTWSGQIGGAGALQLTGGGSFALANTGNTYSGGTLVTGGTTLRANADGVLGGAAGALTLGDATSTATLGIDAPGSVTFARSLTLGALGSTIDTSSTTAATITGSVGGTGGLTKTGAGSLTLSGPVTYAGNTAVLGGRLSTGTGNVFTQGTLSIGSGATVVLNGTQTFGSISGPGGLVLGSGASLALGGNNADIVFSGNISGAGSLTKNGTGTLTLGGTNSYSGGTFLNFGSIAGNTASLQGSIANGGTLVFNQGTDGTFLGSISGTGGLIKNGLGTLTLNGSQTYTGLTQLREGGLSLAAGLAGSILVSPGATLWGAGVVGGSLDVSGTLIVPGTGNPAPTFHRTSFTAKSTTGNSAAGIANLAAAQAPTLVVNGDLTTQPGSTFAFTLAPGSVAPVLVGGVATFNDTHVLVNVDDPTPARVKTYLGISATGGLHVTGGDVTAPSPLLEPVLNPQANALTVTVVNFGVPLPVPVPAAFDPVNGTADFRRVMTEVWALDDASLAPALRSLAGEIHASQVRLVALDSLAMTDMVRNQIDMEESAAEERRTTGAASIRPWFDLGADHADFSAGSANTGGSGGGFDFKPASAWAIGGGGALSTGTLSLSDISGISQMVSPRAFFYSGFSFGPFAVHWGGSRAWTTTSTNRQVAFVAYVPDATGRPVPLSPYGVGTPVDFIAGGTAAPRPGVDRRATAEERSTSSDGWSEWQFAHKFNTWKLDTKLGVRVARFTRRGFAETGADSISLTGVDQTLKSNQTNFDFHLFRPKGTWRPNILVTYRREFGDEFTSADMSFAGNPKSPFSVQGFEMPKNTFQGLFGITMQSVGGLLYTLEYQTLQSSEESRHSLRFKVRLW